MELFYNCIIPGNLPDTVDTGMGITFKSTLLVQLLIKALPRTSAQAGAAGGPEEQVSVHYSAASQGRGRLSQRR